MACQFSPSLCTAAAKGDTSTVEKHLQAHCCNPFATQYFINPDEESHSQSAIVGFVKRKRNVTVVPKNNSDNPSLVKPASPLQVALFYKEEGVLFLLLNHFLKISNGNVSRCYDETAEAIATSNGYSHLMDFFQYYDNINRDTFGACWTEAMRHICDLTTKLIKYRRQNMELLQERDDSSQARACALVERDSAIKERMATYKTMMEQKDNVIQRLQSALREKDSIIADLQSQVMPLREHLDKITGSAALDALQHGNWEVTAIDNKVLVVETGATADSDADSEQNVVVEPCINTSAEHELAPPPGDATTLVISECMRHHLALAKRVEHLKDYVIQCKEKNVAQRNRSLNLVDSVDSLCTWNSKLSAAPDLCAECGLQVGPDGLQIFECGDEPKVLDSVIRQLEASCESNPSSNFSEVAQRQAETASRIRQMLVSNQISNESSIDILKSLMSHLEKIFLSQSIQALLLDNEDSVTRMEQHIQAASQEKARCEEAGSVVAVEKEMNRQMSYQRHLLDLIVEKLEILQSKSVEFESLSAIGDICENALQEVKEVIENRQALSAKCTSDWDVLQAAWKARTPQMEELKEKSVVAAAEFKKSLAENDALQNEKWDAIVDAFADLQILQDSRVHAVQAQMEYLMNLKRQERDTDVFVWASKQHADRLLDVAKKCEASSEVCQMIIEIVQFGQEKIHEWFASNTTELEQQTVAAHQEMYDRFRDWYLTQGEYTHKKKMLLKDVRRKIAETDNRKQLAIQRLDSAAEQHGEALRQLEHQRLDLETTQIPTLESTATAALPLFEATKEYLIQKGIPFTHPELELQQRNEKREMEIHMREVSKYQELLLASQKSLLECSSTLPEVERVLLLENPGKLPDGPFKSEHPVEEKRPKASEVEENRQLKQKLQEYFVMIPLDFLDPITLEIIAEPVIAADGHTYERSSISRWLQRKGTSPKTGEVMEHAELRPNTMVREAIQEWKLKQLQFLAEQDMPHDKGAEADAARSGGNDGAEPPAAAHDVVSVD
jgi:hypothetical protein